MKALKLRGSPIKIVFGDLCHSTKFIANNYVPLNIGFLASFTRETFAKEVEVYLFKSAGRLIDFVKRERPGILALSNYLWNSNLSLYVMQAYKKLCPSGITVLGGPNFPKDYEKIKLWLSKYSFIDFVVEGEGELAFTNLVERIVDNGLDISKTKRSPIKGCYFLNADRMLVYLPQSFLRELDTIPSPYLGGLLDEFLLKDTDNFLLYPLFEGTRGCPYSCTFCRNGHKDYSKIRFFSEERFLHDLSYVANLLKKNNRFVPAILITDQNFGLYEKDYSIAKKLNQFKKIHNFPKHVIVSTGKGNADNVLKTVDAFPVLDLSLSVQSLDREVLENIKRKNFPFKKFKSYQPVLKKKGKLSASEIIVGLPGDTREKHLSTIRKLLYEGIDFINPFSFMMLPGTHAESPEHRKKYSYKTKWRLIPGGFSQIDRKKVLESEEIVVGTDTMSFRDYLYLRRVHLWMVSIFNGVFFRELRKLLFETDTDFVKYIQSVDNAVEHNESPKEITEIAREFYLKNKNEFFDSRQLLLEHYKKNYQQLLFDKTGENLLQKFKFLLYVNVLPLIELLIETFLKLEKQSSRKSLKGYQSIFKVMRIKGRCINSLINAKPITKKHPISFVLNSDINRWLRSEGKEIHQFKYNSEHRYIAYYNDETIKTYREIFDHYETTIEGKGRILHRLGDRYILPTIVRVWSNHL